jgi:ABC-2 type transport system ATP-binding protein
MDDIEALCRRVMIVDHGRLAFDGALADLVRSVQPRKLVTATYAGPVDATALGNEVTVTAHDGADDGGQVLALEVTREALSDTLERLPRLGPLLDLGVADAKVEEIVRDLFASGFAAREEEPAP